MKRISLFEDVGRNSYPGRGIVLGRSSDGSKAVMAYFIMGRSANSRNRVFVTEGEGIRTEAFDPSKMEDPSLIIYAPVRVLKDGTLIVTNGDQTDTIRDALNAGKTWEDALRTRTFEPDGPNWTPRISGLVTVKDGKACYRLSILKSGDGDESVTRRFFYEYEAQAGVGHFIHTYQGDGNPLPSFEGEPEQVCLPESFEAFTDLVWNNLNENNGISLYTCAIDLKTGEKKERIINKLG